MPSFAYNGYTISPRTFLVRGSARWTLDLLIGRNGQLRAFTGPATYATKADAETGCVVYGRHVIDAAPQNCIIAALG